MSIRAFNNTSLKGKPLIPSISYININSLEENSSELILMRPIDGFKENFYKDM